MTTDSSAPAGARRFLGHSSIYAAGNVARQLAGFLMLPVYTRFLSPADYGVVGLMTFTLSLVELVFGARLGLAIPKYFFDTQDRRIQNTVISTALIITGSISAVTSLTVVLLRAPSSQGIFGTPIYATIVGFFASQILTLAVENYGLVFLRLQQRPWLYVTLNFGKLVVQLTLNIWLVVFKEMGVLGIAISSMTSSGLFASLLLIYTLHHVGFGFDRKLARKMINFCWPLWIAGFAGLYIGSANRYYLRIFASMNDVGLYELANKFNSVIMLLIWDPFAQYWQVERFKYYQRGNAEPIFQNVFLIISTLLVLAALGIAIFAGPVIQIMADKAFYRASEAVPFLVFGAVFSSLVSFSNFSFLVHEKTGWLCRNNYITAIVITIFNFALIPLAGHVGAALALMLAQGFQFYLVHRVSRRFYDMGIPLRPLVRIVLISALACWFTNSLLVSDSLLKELAAKLVCYVVVAILILQPIWRKQETHRLIKELISPICRFRKKSNLTRGS